MISDLLLKMCENGDQTEDIWLAEFQRIAGPDAELSAEAQGQLHTLRQQRQVMRSIANQTKRRVAASMSDNLHCRSQGGGE